MKTLAKALGINPEKVLNKEAFLKPHRTILDPQQQKQEKIDKLAKAIKESLIQSMQSV